jgi:hypothetical protein
MHEPKKRTEHGSAVADPKTEGPAGRKDPEDG